jgi:hypothetical protein
MGYNISALEGQNGGRDWPLIVTAVECPTCGAPPGEMCRTMGSTEGPTATSPFVNRGTARIDWHAERKQVAAHAWYTRDQAAQKDSGGKEVPSEAGTADVAAEGTGANSSPAAAPVVEKAGTTGPPPAPPVPPSRAELEKK